MKWDSSTWRQCSALRIGWGAQTSRGESVLLHIERIRLRWFGHLIQIPIQPCPTGSSLRVGPRARCRDYVSQLAWGGFWVPQEELERVAGESGIWPTLFFCHSNLVPVKRKKLKWWDGRTFTNPCHHWWPLMDIHANSLHEPLCSSDS